MLYASIPWNNESMLQSVRYVHREPDEHTEQIKREKHCADSSETEKDCKKEESCIEYKQADVSAEHQHIIPVKQTRQ